MRVAHVRPVSAPPQDLASAAAYGLSAALAAITATWTAARAFAPSGMRGTDVWVGSARGMR